MIFLWIVLWTLAALLLLLLLILVLPFSVRLRYEERFSVLIYFFGIRLYTSDRKHRPQLPEAKEPSDGKPKPEKKNIFKRECEKRGFNGAVHFFSELAGIFLRRLKWALRHIRFGKFRLKLTVGADNAADTAIRYGAVCGAVYPLLSALFGLTHCKGEAVDISADFEHSGISFAFSVVMRAQLIFLVAAALAGFCEYIKIRDVSYDE